MASRVTQAMMSLAGGREEHPDHTVFSEGWEHFFHL